jgi:predicted polyphosphate/ATP-dependent NAD kinase
VENRRLQTRKEPSPASEAGAAAEIANEVARALVPGYRYVLGPGSTIRMLATRLGVPKTLVGVDVVEIDDDGTVRVVASDVGARDLSSLVAETPAVLVVTPIGGQGFILGRGNQQIDPGVVRTVLERLGRAALVVAATPAKLASLRGRPLLVDSGDVELDAALAGHVLVVTGQRERTVYPVIAA